VEANFLGGWTQSGALEDSRAGSIEVNFIVIGTAHEFQNCDLGLEGILRAFLDQRYIDPLVAIAEEFHEAIGDSSLAQRLAFERHLCWCNIDMTDREKADAGILQEQEARRKMVQEGIAFRVPSDDLREDAWVEKLVGPGSGTTLVVCGYVHFEPLVKKLCARGHTTDDRRVYLHTVPEIILLGGRLLQ
jgi:hypothetical protein